MVKKEDPVKIFAFADKIVGVLRSFGVPVPKGDVNIEVVEVLTTDEE